MQKCSQCEKTKPVNDFYFRNKNVQLRHKQCKQCYKQKRSESWQKYYYKHGNKYRHRAISRNRKIKDNLKKQMLSYLQDKCCVSCGIEDSRVLEFDHIDPDSKSASISRLINSTTNWDNVLQEINKCQILCANCHKIKTSKEQNWYKS